MFPAYTDTHLKKLSKQIVIYVYLSFTYRYFLNEPLSEVNLASNTISRLNDGTFGHLTSLSLLDLSHNSLMRIEDNVFVGMNISHLDLGYNNLHKLPDALIRL